MRRDSVVITWGEVTTASLILGILIFLLRV
jgi:hypothetical protein